MLGIDVSGYDGFDGSHFNGYTEPCYRQSGFVIVKATQGTGFTHGAYARIAQRVLADGKLLGFYHYAGGRRAEVEADYFYSRVREFVGRATFWLDWEQGQNAAWGSTSWTRRFVEQFHALSGVWPGIYVQASARSQVASCADVSALWVAGYPDLRSSWSVPSFRYGTSPWGAYTIWQYTDSGGHTDRDIYDGDAARWAALAGSEDDLPTPNDVWAFTNDGQQEDTVPGSAWTNLLDTNRRLQQLQAVLGSDGTHSVLDNVVDTNLRLQELQTSVAAQAEAIRALAAAQGADPEAIAKSVSDAVAAKLSEIKLSVTTDGQAQP